MAVRVGRKGTKVIYFTVNVWYDTKSRMIKLTSNDTDHFATTVSNDPASKRYHPNMFKKLKRVLEENDRWPT